jgi:hypothetical protein
MKLVELLAKELTKWPADGFKVKYLTQDSDGWIASWEDDGPLIFAGDHWKIADSCPVDQLTKEELAEDHKESIVTRAQWQAERDRQKGGEWKRHRGGRNQPVAGDVLVEVKLRDGDIQQAKASAFLWNHSDCDVYANIMQYRIVSQPQAEEVEPVTIEQYEEETVKMLDAYFDGCKSYAPEAQWQQSSGPLAWRDTIIHCQAIIEDCEREIAANENRLALEGFALIPAMTPVMGAAAVKGADVSGWRSWNAGDEIECVFSECNNIYTVGNVYTVKKIEEDYAVVTDDTCYGGGTCHINDDDLSDVRFIRCP